MSEITVATSIAPGNTSSQRIAIASWLELGLKVVSLNIQDEIDVLAPEFPAVSFVPASRSALHLAGRPYVYFDDILQALFNSGSEICGIINSDIVLSQRIDIVGYVRKLASDKLLYASRTDVSDINDEIGKIYPYGFDVFFFPRKLALEYPVSEFCLGVPWWDYWALIVPVAKGFPIIELIGSIAFHVRHEVKWDRNLHGSFCRSLLDCVQKSGLLADVTEEPLQRLLPAYEENNYFLISLLYLQYIQHHAQVADLDTATGGNFFLTHQYVDLRKELIKAKIHAYYAAAEINGLKRKGEGLSKGETECCDMNFNVFSGYSGFCKAFKRFLGKIFG